MIDSRRRRRRRLSHCKAADGAGTAAGPDGTAAAGDSAAGAASSAAAGSIGAVYAGSAGASATVGAAASAFAGSIAGGGVDEDGVAHGCMYTSNGSRYMCVCTYDGHLQFKS